jgi:predicted HTH domain antitoxin
MPETHNQLIKVISLIITLPDNLIKDISLTEREAIFELALGLYVDRKATLGQAARLAGVSRPSFLDALGERQVPIHYDEADLEADLQTLQTLDLNSNS